MKHGVGKCCMQCISFGGGAAICNAHAFSHDHTVPVVSQIAPVMAPCLDLAWSISEVLLPQNAMLVLQVAFIFPLTFCDLSCFMLCTINILNGTLNFGLRQ